MSAPIVHSLSPMMAGVGCPVTISGCGFSAYSSVKCGYKTIPASECADDSLTFSAPGDSGTYAVSVTNGEEYSEELKLVVVELCNVPVRRLPERDEEEFRDSLLGLMPRGFAWYKGNDGNWWKLLSAFGSTFAEVYGTLRSLVDESSPLKTTSYASWEKELGLPRKGLEFSEDSDRLAEIYRIARRPGGCTVPYFKGIVSLFGLGCRVYEYWKNSEKFEDVDFGTDDPNFYWMVQLEYQTSEIYTDVFSCNSECDDYLRTWWRENVETLLELSKPAHTKLVFTYVEDIEGRSILTEDEFEILTEDGEAILTEE